MIIVIIMAEIRVELSSIVEIDVALFVNHSCLYVIHVDSAVD